MEHFIRTSSTTWRRFEPAQLGLELVEVLRRLRSEPLPCTTPSFDFSGRQALVAVKRQYSGTLGKIGTCQITVMHAVGQRGTALLGWSLYLPEEWCEDWERRRKAKIPDEVVFQTKPQLAAALCEQAAGWEVPAAPVLADSAYGDDSGFRTCLHGSGLE